MPTGNLGVSPGVSWGYPGGPLGVSWGPPGGLQAIGVCVGVAVADGDRMGIGRVGFLICKGDGSAVDEDHMGLAQ